ncbi:hypothetical protein NMY22_g4110 [Coprinellus aureogranulatus]|nr:hypothetical protein NMY22_g4110 [Coprinellus aureogranulatus]
MAPAQTLYLWKRDPQGPDTVSALFTFISRGQYPAQPLTQVDRELGYPCYVPSNEEWARATVSELGMDVRRYISFASTAAMLLLAVVTLIMRYRGHAGRLVRVLRRDDGIYYIAVAGIRFGQAIHNKHTCYTGAEQKGHKRMGSNRIIERANFTVVPILAQRLMINLRRADYMGSEPVASKLLFATPASSTDPDIAEDDGT